MLNSMAVELERESWKIPLNSSSLVQTHMKMKKKKKNPHKIGRTESPSLEFYLKSLLPAL